LLADHRVSSLVGALGLELAAHVKALHKVLSRQLPQLPVSFRSGERGKDVRRRHFLSPQFGPLIDVRGFIGPEQRETIFFSWGGLNASGDRDAASGSGDSFCRIALSASCTSAGRSSPTFSRVATGFPPCCDQGIRAPGISVGDDARDGINVAVLFPSQRS
jgi:hypothetical protein